MYTSEVGNRVVWIRNQNGTAFADEEFVITSQLKGPARVLAYDVDHDGDADCIVVSQFDDTISWFENVGVAKSSSFFSPVVHTINIAAGAPVSFELADMDMDGDDDSTSPPPPLYMHQRRVTLVLRACCLAFALAHPLTLLECL